MKNHYVDKLHLNRYLLFIYFIPWKRISYSPTKTNQVRFEKASMIIDNAKETMPNRATVSSLKQRPKNFTPATLPKPRRNKANAKKCPIKVAFQHRGLFNMYKVITPSTPTVTKKNKPEQTINSNRFFRPASLCFRKKLKKLLIFSVLKKRTGVLSAVVRLSGTQNRVQIPARRKQAKIDQADGMKPTLSIHRPLVN